MTINFKNFMNHTHYLTLFISVITLSQRYVHAESTCYFPVTNTSKSKNLTRSWQDENLWSHITLCCTCHALICMFCGSEVEKIFYPHQVDPAKLAEWAGVATCITGAIWLYTIKLRKQKEHQKQISSSLKL